MEKINFNAEDFNIMVNDDGKVSYNCSVCRDTGWLITPDGAIPCQCQKKKNRERILAASGLTPILAEKTFDKFDFTYYEEYLKNERGSTYRTQAQKIYDICLRYAQNFSSAKTHRGIVLQGEVGRGKTFLAAAVCNALIDKNIVPYFMVVPEFLDEIRATYNNGGEFSESKIMDKAMNATFLVMDDLGSHNFSAWTIGKLFTLINYRVNHGLPFMITTNLSIADLQDTLGDRIISRIAEACDFYNLQAGNDIRMLLNIKEMGD